MDEKKALFDYVLVITLNPGPDKNAPPEPVIDYRFPPASGDILSTKNETSKTVKKNQAEETLMQNVLTFCFPDIASKKVRPKRNSRTKTYRFVLTNEDYSKRYGYCVRTLPEEGGLLKTKRYSECFCIISFLPCFSLFEPILELVEEKRHSQSKTQIFMFLKSILAQPFPPPGGLLELECISAEGNKMERHSFVRPPDADNLLAYIPIMPLLRAVSVTHLVQIFASLLRERPIILVSSEVDILSDCVQAAAALVYPFSWQGILVPVMGEKMMMMCASPTPFLVGVLRHHLSIITGMVDEGMMDAVMIFDLDKEKFIMEAKNQDDMGSLPEYPVKKLAAALTEFYKTYKPLFKKDSKQDFPSGHFHIPFVDFHVSIFGHYQSGMEKTPGGKRPYTWNQAKFMAATPAAHLTFVNEFSTNTQMFGQFLNEREMHLTKFNGPFDAKVNELGLATVATMDAVVVEDTRKSKGPIGLQDRLKSDAKNATKNVLQVAAETQYTCPKCSKSFSGWRKFCSECGAKMPDERPEGGVSPNPSPRLGSTSSMSPSQSFSGLPPSASTASLASSSASSVSFASMSERTSSCASLPPSSSSASLLPASSSFINSINTSSSASSSSASFTANLPPPRPSPSFAPPPPSATSSSSSSTSSSTGGASNSAKRAIPPSVATAATTSSAPSWVRGSTPPSTPAATASATATSSASSSLPILTIPSGSGVRRKSALESLMETKCVCGKTPSPGVRFCNHCGTKLAQDEPSPRPSSGSTGEKGSPEASLVLCSSCGKGNAAHLKFCVDCGTGLQPPPPPANKGDGSRCNCKGVAPSSLKFCTVCGGKRQTDAEGSASVPVHAPEESATAAEEREKRRRWDESSRTILGSVPSAARLIFSEQERNQVVNGGPQEKVQERLALLAQKEAELVEVFQWIMNQRERLERGAAN